MILVVIVTYNGLKWIDSLLQPFVQDREGLEVAVLDNASTDGTPQAIRERYPFVHLTEWRTNLGFGAANNKLLEQAIVGDYEGAFLLNQDASITAEAIRALAKYVASYPEIGLLSPKHLNAQGEVESGFAHYLPSEEREPFTEVPFINAALWYLPRRTLEMVGLFSPLFQHYGEDLDYAHRVLAEGLKIGYLPSVTAYHYRGNIGECTSEKAYQLKRAYHIAEAVHPLYPKWKRIYRGYLAPLGESVKALFGGTKEDYAHSKRLYHLVRELIAMSSTMKLWQHRPALDVDALRRVYKLSLIHI